MRCSRVEQNATARSAAELLYTEDLGTTALALGDMRRIGVRPIVWGCAGDCASGVERLGRGKSRSRFSILINKHSVGLRHSEQPYYLLASRDSTEN